ncbi:UDP-N-acetylmuramoyl-L-alanyl-D-glutamate--2,6-diaminopimelate ligase [Gordonia phosphorivorans]|uniref:UDP-N-acetylmuramoyl-L-alanyl-D-glutamate--2,6-diaminopimelate ligase n=1 Tax=Gordonia phosphorivorans TaxID=1056982 RepID=A0ABV6H4K2_9ACTN
MKQYLPVRPEHPVGADLTALAELSGATVIGGDRTVIGATLRAQHAGAGDLFAALPGARVHGARYAVEAVAAGAVAVLTDDEGLAILRADPATADVSVLLHPQPRSVLGVVSARIYGDPSQRLTLLGITGTSGKTTTAYLTEAALRAGGRVVGLIGTVEIRIDGTPVPSSLTTPEAPDLQRMFAVMRERGVDTVVMEVSSHALALGRVDGTRFAVGGFTNLSQDHLDFHHTMDEYFRAKADLFDGAAPNHAAAAVICVDDEWGEQMAQIARGSAERLATVSVTGAADWSTVGEVAADAGLQTVAVRGPDGAEHVLAVPLPGAYNVANALLAVGLATAAGVPTGTAIGGLAQVRVPGRVEQVDRGQDFLAVVDYAHKPAAVEAVLATLAAQTSGSIAVVLGAGGDRDTEKRPLMGAAAARAADLVIITDDNPRSEDSASIRAAVRAGAEAVPAAGRRAAEIRETGDRAAAIAEAVAWAGPGDVVLVAGKGHETGQEIAGQVYPFDDREVLAAALTERAAAPEPLIVYLAPPEATVDQATRLLREMVTDAVDAGVGSAHRTDADASQGRRTWAFFGDLADGGVDENARCVTHDLVGRRAVRLAVDQTVAVGDTRAVRALYQGAIQEGSWGDEAGFFLTVDELLAQQRADAGTAAAPRAGDMVLIAGGGELAHALVDIWQRTADLTVQVHNR